jgi:hypothetical protein
LSLQPRKALTASILDVAAGSRHGSLGMKRSRANPWFGIGWDAWRLGMEASAVIGLRTLKIAQGGADGQAEAERMVSEKVQAGMDLQALALTGGLGVTPASASARTLAHYRRRVSANRRRLSKG